MTTTGRLRADERRTEVLEELVDLFLAEGFAHASVADLAARLRCSKSTLYLLAPSKEQIVVSAVRHYFRRAADRVEARVAECADAAQRLTAYLGAVSDELRPASAAFREDLAAYAPAAAVYRDNTTFAARRVQQLVADGVAAGGPPPP
ncbi:TetR/AcrR family transcriptional regulator, partial [Nostocoides japonicum]|uniref:TetR/AcrR family transcriptional regulator n=1 Tax=Nostocoides japonicum TaxID=99481 RepID=UPI0012F9FC7A